MKKLLLLTFCISLFLIGTAQVYQPGSTDQVGINEHLGETIPLDLVFKNEKNETVVLGDLITKPTILSFVYFDCPGICTPLLENLSDVIEQMDLKLGEDYNALSISFNKNDDTEKAVKKKKNLVCELCVDKQEHWKYLTGDSLAIEKILTSVGFAVKRTGNDFLHAGAIIIVSPKGKITRYLYGIRYMPLDLKLALIEAEDGLARPTIHRVLNFCYSYDPVGKQYGLEITKLIGTFILILIVITMFILFFRSRKKKAN
ncbi:MAG: SCO family protein [Bacteroidetes bacterium]|nr:SCO family protein [Bacteroidota bacterium]